MTAERPFLWNGDFAVVPRVLLKEAERWHWRYAELAGTEQLLPDFVLQHEDNILHDQ